uniref:Uncharacterized protein n=1 Tax=Amphimedon queenslandica TaxID=400682 RepID=A0A1X7UGX1_AMPQE
CKSQVAMAMTRHQRCVASSVVLVLQNKN